MLLLGVLLVLLLLKVLVMLLRHDSLWVILSEHLGSLVCVVLLLFGRMSVSLVLRGADYGVQASNLQQTLL